MKRYILLPVMLIAAVQLQAQQFTINSNDRVECSGTSQLENGAAHIDINLAFQKLVAPDFRDAFTITVTPQGGCNDLEAVNISSTGFDVQEKNGGDSSVNFSWKLEAVYVDNDKNGIPDPLEAGRNNRE